MRFAAELGAIRFARTSGTPGENTCVMVVSSQKHKAESSLVLGGNDEEFDGDKGRNNCTPKSISLRRTLLLAGDLDMRLRWFGPDHYRTLNARHALFLNGMKTGDFCRIERHRRLV